MNNQANNTLKSTLSSNPEPKTSLKTQEPQNFRDLNNNAFTNYIANDNRPFSNNE